MVAGDEAASAAAPEVVDSVPTPWNILKERYSDDATDSADEDDAAIASSELQFRSYTQSALSDAKHNQGDSEEDELDAIEDAVWAELLVGAFYRLSLAAAG
jgi:hypothetical protein